MAIPTITYGARVYGTNRKWCEQNSGIGDEIIEICKGLHTTGHRIRSAIKPYEGNWKLHR